MKIQYDSETDTLLLIFSERTPVEADILENNDDFIWHYDVDNQPVQLEVLQASQRIDNVHQMIFETMPNSQSLTNSTLKIPK